MSASAAQLRCQELVELVTDYLEGQLDPARVAALDEHLANCDGCDAYVEQMRQTVRALRGLADGQEIYPQTREAVLEAFTALHPAG